MNKTFKTISALILVAIIAITVLTACGASKSVVGKWAPAGSEQTICFEFTSDGKMTVSTMGITAISADYEIKGDNIVYSVAGLETEMPYTLDGGTLTLGYSGISYTLEKVD